MELATVAHLGNSTVNFVIVTLHDVSVVYNFYKDVFVHFIITQFQQVLYDSCNIVEKGKISGLALTE